MKKTRTILSVGLMLLVLGLFVQPFPTAQALENESLKSFTSVMESGYDSGGTHTNTHTRDNQYHKFNTGGWGTPGGFYIPYKQVRVRYHFDTDWPSSDFHKLVVKAEGKTSSGTAYLQIYNWNSGWESVTTFGTSETLKTKTYITNFDRFINSNGEIRLRWVLSGIKRYLYIDFQEIVLERHPLEALDGIDTGMLEFINYPELQTALGGVVRGTTIAILDTGLDPDVYDYVKGDGDPARQYLHATYYEWNGQSYDMYTESQKDQWQDDGTTGAKHGSAMFSAAASVARGAEYLIYNINLNDYDSIPEALHHIYTHHTSGGPDGWEGLVISMSWSIYDLSQNSTRFNQLLTMFNALRDTGVLCVAAAGNITPWRLVGDKFKKQFDQPYELHPNSFESVLAVGACFDEAPYWNGGTELWEPIPVNMRGRRISWSATQTLYSVSDPWDNTHPNYKWIWASNHWNQPDWFDWRIVAPGFCIEICQPISDGYQQSGDDVEIKNCWGTSPATAIVAAAGAIMKYYHPESLAYLVFRLQNSAELTSTTNPAPRPHVYDTYYDEFRGWGILDIYDTWHF